MLREILFRGKDKDNGKWVEGFYSKLNIPIFGYLSDFINVGGYQAVEIIPETVGQYTGLKDKNGKKIFEGDILGGSFGEYKRKVAVGYCEQTAMFCFGEDGQSYFEFDFTDATEYCLDNLRLNEFEVIGTIHDKEEEQC